MAISARTGGDGRHQRGARGTGTATTTVFSDNYGFTGIAVALLGRNHPFGVVVAALLFAVLQRGGVPVDAFTQLVSKDIVLILQALVILFVAAEAAFRRGGRG